MLRRYLNILVDKRVLWDPRALDGARNDGLPVAGTSEDHLDVATFTITSRNCLMQCAAANKPRRGR